MTTNKPATFQDLIKRKHQKLFVGREEYLNFFERNLALSIDDERRQSIINIHGQAGVGKSSLLERFRRLADNNKAVTAVIDESAPDVPSVLDRIAQQIAQQGPPLKTFKDTYKLYRQRRQELEADPEMPKGLAAIVGRVVVKTGLSLVRSAPLGNVIADFIDENSLGDQLGEWGSYVARKIKDKDEVALLQDPVAILTPLVLKAFKDVSEECLVVLFFDTYERSRSLLEPWINHLMLGHFGDLPANIIFVIAGQQELDKNKWAAYEGLIHRIALEPFTEDEARDYINRQGIADERVIETILAITGRLPLLVATLVAESPKDPGEVGSPTGTAILRFLKWVDTDRQRQLALNAAIPRTLNRDVLQIFADSENLESDFRWLKEMPFVQERHDYWAYHDVVRSQMLRHKRSESPQTWTSMHGQLSRYYRKLIQELGVSDDQAHLNPQWKRYRQEWLYHELCYAPQKELAGALNGFIRAWSVDKDFASDWAETVLGAGRDSEASELLDWGERLVQAVQLPSEFDPVKTIGTLTKLIESDNIEQGLQGELYYRRGTASFLLGDFQQAIEDLNRALALMPENFYCWLSRGYCNFFTGKHEQAKKDLLRASELDPDSYKPPVLLACIYYFTGHKRQAVETLNASSIWRPEVTSLIVLIAESFFVTAPKVDELVRIPSYSQQVSASLELLRGLDNKFAKNQLSHSLLEGAVSGFIQEGSTIISTASPDLLHGVLNILVKSAPFTNAVQDEGDRGTILEKLESLANERDIWQASLDALGKVVPFIYYTIPQVVFLRLNSGQYDDALFLLDHATKIYGGDVLIQRLRSDVFIRQGRYDEALVNLNEIITSESPLGDFVTRGLLLTYLGRYGEAVEAYTDALLKYPGDFVLLYNLAVAITRLKGILPATPHLDKAREALIELLESEKHAKALYGIGGLDAVIGDHERALNNLREAVKADVSVLEWAHRDVAWIDMQTHPEFRKIVDSS